MKENTVCLPIGTYDSLRRTEEEFNSINAIAIFEAEVWGDPFAGILTLNRTVLSKNEAIDAMAAAVKRQGEEILMLKAERDRPIRVADGFWDRLVFLFTGMLDIGDPKGPPEIPAWEINAKPHLEEEIREQVSVQCYTCDNITPMMLTKDEQEMPIEFLCPVCSIEGKTLVNGKNRGKVVE